MKRLLLLLSLFAVLAAGCYYDGNKRESEETPAKDTSLTLQAVKGAFAQAGLPLENGTKRQRYYVLSGELPTMLEGDQGEFAVYVFQNEQRRIQGRKDFDNQTATMKVALSKIYEIRNVLIFELTRPLAAEKMTEVERLLGGEVPLLTLEDVTASLKRQRLELQPSQISYDFFKLGMEQEYSFRINEHEEIYIYVFDSAKEVSEGIKQLEHPSSELYDIAHTPTRYAVKNVLLQYMRYPPIEGVEEQVEQAVDSLYRLEGNPKRDQAPSKEPPVPRIMVNGAEVPVVPGTYCWKYKGTGTCADTIPPYDLVKKLIPAVATPKAELTITFDPPPKEQGLNIWLDKKPKGTAINGNKVTLPDEKGTYVYDVFGWWKQGSASYGFAVEVR